MIDYRKAAHVPVWTLATRDVQVPAVIGDGPMTAERLAELRGVLAALADHPIATLEAHPMPDKLDRSRGIPLDAASPLAQHLSQLLTESAKTSATAAKATASGEILCRVVVPAKVAEDFGQGLIRWMEPKGATGASSTAPSSSQRRAGSPPTRNLCRSVERQRRARSAARGRPPVRRPPAERYSPWPRRSC